MAVHLSIITDQNVFAANVTYLDNTIRNFFSDNRHHLINIGYKNRSRNFIFDELKRFGLETEFHNFTLPSGVQCVNIISVIKGDRFGTAGDKIIGLGAHYDTVNNTKGVDDNGAGVAAMLEVAKQMSPKFNPHTKRNNTVIFVSFDLEEEGYRGSSLFIDEWLNPWILTNYGEAGFQIVPHGIIILDTMMEFNLTVNSQKTPNLQLMQDYFPRTAMNILSDDFKGDFIATIYRAVPDRVLAYTFVESWMALPESNYYQIEKFALPLNDVTGLPDYVYQNLGNFLRSDHYNFWTNNIPAIFLTDSADFRGDMIGCYHQQCDNIDVMLTEDNIKFLGKTVDAIYKTMHLLSEPETATSHGNMNRHVSSALFTFLVILKIMK